MQHLQAGIPFEHLQRPAQQAHGTQEPPPGQLDAGNAQQPPYEADTDERQPEFKGIGSGTQRADVAAPETLDKEAAQENDSYGCECHPKDDFALERGGGGIVGIQFLAEEFAGTDGEIKDHEEQDVFDNAQDGIENGAFLGPFRTDTQGFADAGQQVLDGSYRAQIAAEQLAEEDDRGGQGNAHQDLGGAHAAGERALNEEGGQGLQASHRAEGFRVGGIGTEKFRCESGQEEDQGGQGSPLENDTGPVVLFFSHRYAY